ncbi:LacI family DNA-binding transcriptional regulator [Bosea sp. WAO]|uniref:LacI family DNA-binding transcriptional regulator n=1 Tax=Bosea sp. WAO TaxID=406341 RepID=UPI0009F9A347|nr:LacI family DNA-binding transcriptional regulator [Bosea sp. WAO]
MPTRGPGMVTARQVAESLGVAVSTVGRALADDPRISQRMKLMVREAAQRLGYVENLPAQMMRGGSSRLIGLMLPDIRNSFYATIADALSACCDAAGYQLVVSLADNPEAESRHVRQLASARAAGIVIVPTPDPQPETCAMLARIPHVQLLRRVPQLSPAWFGIDDMECLRAGTGHLIARGHRRIAYIGGTGDYSTGADRLAGFRRAFAEAGLDPALATEHLGPPADPRFGATATAALFADAEPPSAIITGAVQLTGAVLQAIAGRPHSDGREPAIVGFGDEPSFSWWRGELTAIAMPIQELAQACGGWLIERLDTGAPIEAHSSMASAQLVEYRSDV